MTTSRRRMRDVSQSLGIAFNIAQAQEALYRADAGAPLDTEERALFTLLACLFQDALVGLQWTQATAEGKEGEDAVGNETRALRSLGVVLPVVRKHSATPREALQGLSEIATRLSGGEHVAKEQRRTFDAVLGDLARYVGSRLDNVLEERGNPLSLLRIPE